MTRARLVSMAIAFMLQFACSGDMKLASLDAEADDLNASAPVAGCGRSVTRTGNTIVVAPSGGEDTENVQCALDAAASLAEPMTVKLKAGTFHTAQLVATEFHGQFRGSGEGATLLTNVTRPLFTVDIPPTGPVTPSSPWPALVAFVGGNFSVSDLTIGATGVPTTGWKFFGAPFSTAFEANVVAFRRKRARMPVSIA